MNENNDTPEHDQSHSLLRRLHNDDQQSPTPENQDAPVPGVQPFPPDVVIPPLPGYPIPPLSEEDLAEMRPAPSPLSPIRPHVPEDNTDPPPEPLTPSLPDRTPPERTSPARALSPREQMQQAEEALINLRQKMARIAAEFANGTLNQAQFDAIYSRYSEQRAITERLLTRNPESQAWQSVVRSGHTQFLKQHFAARPLSYAIYDQTTSERIGITGTVQLRHEQVEAVLQRLAGVIARRGNPGPAKKQLNDGKCVLFVPGEHAAAVVIFTLEPSAGQIDRIRDIHRDFERANQRALSRHDYDRSRMVFPHRALFESETFF